MYIQQFVLPEFQDILQENNNTDILPKLIGNKGRVEVEYMTTEHRWCRAVWFPVDIIDGKVKTIVFAIEDIHENKIKDERLKQQLYYIDGLISGYDMLMIYNIDEGTCSHSYYADFAPDDCKKPYFEVLDFYDHFTSSMKQYCHPDHLEMMLCYSEKDYVRQMLKNKKRHTRRFLCKNAQGEYRWTEMQLIKFAKEGETANDVAITYIDVDSDEREKRAKEAALEDIKNVVRSNEMGLWHITLIQGQEPSMTVDSKMRQLLGLKDDLVLTDEEMYKAWFDRVLPEALDSVNASVMKMIKEGVRDENTYLWNHPTLGHRYVRCGGTAIPIMGGHLLSGYHYDVTEHVLAEMRQKQLLEDALEANKAKTVSLHNMVHEIRTPLNSIIGFSQLLAMPDGTWTPEEKETHLQQINNGYNILSMLIDDVLDVADSEHGNFMINISETNINTMCRNALQAAMFRKPQSVNMYFTTEVDDDYTIESDGRRITQVLFNYLNNACKHTWAGEVHLHCSTTENPGRLTFSVADTGEGVPAEMAEGIFERFTKHNAKVKGSGIGLNICRVLAEKLNGEVHLDTSYTNGARFVFIL
ncbi:MAG: HAMP domain-containing sensor histidine kinase [Bacteroidia bacterium]|nr:HAMP domain-containing sensor histidine kinase [Bacteroidia bacterium]